MTDDLSGLEGYVEAVREAQLMVGYEAQCRNCRGKGLIAEGVGCAVCGGTGGRAVDDPAIAVLALAEPLRRAGRVEELAGMNAQWRELTRDAERDLLAAEKRIEELEIRVAQQEAAMELMGGEPLGQIAWRQKQRIEELEAEVERLTIPPGAMPNALPAGGPSGFNAEPHYHQKRPPQLSQDERERRRGGVSPLDRLGDPLAAAEKRIEELEAALRHEHDQRRKVLPASCNAACRVCVLLDLDTEAKP